MERPLGDHADQAVQWLRRMRKDGHYWDALPAPSVKELHPNAKGDPGEWSSAVKQMVEQTEDLTVSVVRQRGQARRRKRHGADVLEESQRDT